MTEAQVHFQGTDAEHLAPHNLSSHGLLHTLVYSFNLSGNQGKERLFAQPQSRLKEPVGRMESQWLSASLWLPCPGPWGFC